MLFFLHITLTKFSHISLDTAMKNRILNEKSNKDLVNFEQPRGQLFKALLAKQRR